MTAHHAETAQLSEQCGSLRTDAGANPALRSSLAKPRIGPVSSLRSVAGPWRRPVSPVRFPRGGTDPFLANPYPSVTGAASLVACALGLAIACVVMVLIGAPL